MTRRVIIRLMGALFLGAAVAVLIPGSPVYLPKVMDRGGQYDGHSARYWIESLNHSDKEIQKKSIFALGALGSEASETQEAIPALAKFLGDPDREIRIEAALALSKMDQAASRQAVPALAQA